MPDEKPIEPNANKRKENIRERFKKVRERFNKGWNEHKRARPIAYMALVLFLGWIGSYIIKGQTYSWGEVKTVFSNLKTIPAFFVTWVLFIFIIWLLIVTIASFVRQEKQSYKLFLALSTLISLVFLPSAAHFALTSTNPYKGAWWIAWVVSVFFMISHSRMQKTEMGEDSKHEKLFIFYVFGSLIAAPFYSAIAGATAGKLNNLVYLVFGLAIHFTIGISIRNFANWSEFEKKSEEKEKEIRREQREEERWQKDYDLREKQVTAQINNPFIGLTEGMLNGKLGLLNGLQSMAMGGHGNIQTMYPLMTSIAQGIPANDIPKLPPIIKFDAEGASKRINKTVSEEKKEKATAEEKFSVTRPGREAEYLIQIARELEDRKNWEKYFGKDWKELKFADNWKQFRKNDGWEDLYKKMTGMIGRPGKIKTLIRNRIELLIRNKKTDVKRYTKYILNKHEKIAPELKQKYQEIGRKIDDANRMINSYNGVVDEINKNLNILRINLQRASGNVPEEQRRALISSIVIAFRETLDGLKRIMKQREEIGKKMKEYRPLLKDTGKLERFWNKIVGYSTIFEDDYGFELAEEPA